MPQAYYLTTFDNPFDPNDDFISWMMYDIDKGYNSCGLLDRVARTSDAMSEEESIKEINRAIDEIIKYDVQNIYTKVAIRAS